MPKEGIKKGRTEIAAGLYKKDITPALETKIERVLEHLKTGSSQSVASTGSKTHK